jgi:ribonuclease-3
LPDDGYGYIPLQKESSECLEWLGDGIIQSVTAQYLWKRYPRQDEGFLTKTRSKLVRTDALAKLARYLKLQQHVLLSTYMEEESNGRDNPKVLEDAFEAFIGAMVEDLGKDEFEGYKICYQFIIRLFEKVIDFAEVIKRDNNYKDKLMRYCHQRFKGINPQYENIDITLDGKNKIYTEIVRDIEDRDNIIGKASARSKKEAQQQAARMALEYYKKN